MTTEAFLAGFGKPLLPRQFGDVVTILTDPSHEGTTAFGLKGDFGIRSLDTAVA